MGIRFYKEPELKDPILVAAWPGIGNIGIIAVDNLRTQLEAELFADIEPMEFFYPKRVFIRHGELKEMEFPESQFYYRKMEGHDLILFIGEEQPTRTCLLNPKLRLDVWPRR